MSLKLVPDAGHAVSTATDKSTQAPSALGVPDTLRTGHTSLSARVNAQHPLQARLEGWERQQQDVRMETMRRVYGAAEPVRRGMELGLCRAGERHTGFRSEQGIGADILSGSDWKLDVSDVWHTREMARGGEYREAMEKRMTGGI